MDYGFFTRIIRWFADLGNYGSSALDYILGFGVVALLGLITFLLFKKVIL